ncbi:MAG TPA: sigma factor [Acidobacteriaceae bacterium]|nr:sigma factor [Acidobacteriaceae bacterium]
MTPPRNASGRLASQETTQQDVDQLASIGLGDERALASLYDRHSTVVYSVALRVCHDPAVAEEVLQNIFMQIWLAPHQFASTSAGLDATLGLLSRNLAVDLKRRRKSSTELGRPAPISHTEVSLLINKPHSLVLLLPDADRRILDMAFFDDKAPREIARETDLPLDTVTARLGNAMAALRSAACNAEVSEDDGLEVLDLDSTPEFTGRNLHTRDLAVQMEGLRRLTHSFVENPDNILQELVNAAVDLCGADSAGISLETEHKNEDNYWHWVATAGEYNGFLHATLPRYPSACGVCLERGKPQLFRVRQRFFDIMGINAPLVTDGILLPWQVDETRGTIFIMAHGRTAAFDGDDGQLMRVLADFAAMAVRHQRQQHALLQQAKASAAAEMANQLAHKINNPLQSLMNVAHLAAEGHSDQDAKTLGQELSVELRQLSALVAKSLAPPDSASQN